MTPQHFDLIVLGAGSSARDGAGKAARDYNANVALAERVRWGGSCPNVACKPTKAYLVSAELVHDVNELAGLLGIEVGRAKANLARIKERKDSLKKPQPKWVEDLNDSGFTTFDGEASLVDANTVRVGEEEISADRILIATGSRTAVPPIDGIEEIDWIDHISALELTELPDSLLVLGGGAVGLEFGQTFARFGSRVTIVDALERISARSDLDATNELTAALEDEGIEVVVNTFVKRVVNDGKEVVATLAPRDGGPERELRVSKVLLASGRVPNLEELDLDRAGIEYTKMGITVDEHMRTSVDGIWAVGDVTAIAQFTPIAQYQARIAVDDMFTGEGPAADYSILPTSIFTDPELAGVGLAEYEAAEQGFEVETVIHPLASVQRASYTNTKHGLFKIVFDRSSRSVLGLHVVARGASDVIQGYSLALKKGITVDEIATAHHVFPTIGEGVKAAAEKARVPVSAA
jgi:pyruvate/2-oxoglutarate dehydrogenase complex dihydrolipoamide dehydrogenase (E3) component